MSLYAAQTGLQNNYEFQQRVQACITQETQTWETANIQQILGEIIADVVASPGFATKFLYGDQTNEIPPGQLAITDNEILSAVQPLLADYAPAGELTTKKK